MTSDYYLDRCRLLRIRADKLNERYKELESIATSPGHASFDGASNILRADKNEQKVLTMTEAREKKLKAEFKYWKYRAWLFDLLIDIPSNAGTVLIKRYINEMEIKDIRKELGTKHKPKSGGQYFWYLAEGKKQFEDMLISVGKRA